MDIYGLQWVFSYEFEYPTCRDSTEAICVAADGFISSAPRIHAGRAPWRQYGIFDHKKQTLFSEHDTTSG